MVSIFPGLEPALMWVMAHYGYHGFKIERQPSGGFAVMFKQKEHDDWEYVP